MLTNKDKEILDFLKDRDGKISPAKTKKDYLQKHGYYDYLINRYSDNSIKDCIPEILYHMLNNIEVLPTCKMCGNPNPRQETQEDQAVIPLHYKVSPV